MFIFFMKWTRNLRNKIHIKNHMTKNRSLSTFGEAMGSRETFGGPLIFKESLALALLCRRGAGFLFLFPPGPFRWCIRSVKGKMLEILSVYIFSNSLWYKILNVWYIKRQIKVTKKSAYQILPHFCFCANRSTIFLGHHISHMDHFHSAVCLVHLTPHYLSCFQLLGLSEELSTEILSTVHIYRI